MIARVWTARARTEGADGYAAHYREHVLPVLSRIDGYKGATLLRRAHGDGVELIVISLWISEDAIRRFAGADISRAVVEEPARRVLVSFDDVVRHYEVVASDRQ